MEEYSGGPFISGEAVTAANPNPNPNPNPTLTYP